MTIHHQAAWEQDLELFDHHTSYHYTCALSLFTPVLPFNLVNLSQDSIDYTDSIWWLCACPASISSSCETLHLRDRTTCQWRVTGTCLWIVSTDKNTEGTYVCYLLPAQCTGYQEKIHRRELATQWPRERDQRLAIGECLPHQSAQTPELPYHQSSPESSGTS